MNSLIGTGESNFDVCSTSQYPVESTSGRSRWIRRTYLSAVCEPYPELFLGKPCLFAQRDLFKFVGIRILLVGRKPVSQNPLNLLGEVLPGAHMVSFELFGVGRIRSVRDKVCGGVG